MKFAVCHSFGKDSALALWRMVQAGHTPVCLITTYNEEAGRSWFHGVSPQLMQAAAESLGVPLVACACKGEDYHLRLEEALAQAKALGAQACVFGDIDIEGHLAWNRARCESVGLECLMPLWRENRDDVVRECIGEGFSIIVKCVQNEYRDILGRRLDEEALALLAQKGADPCGENGEYHTFVFGGPTFRRTLPVTAGPPMDLGEHSAVELYLDKQGDP